MFFLLKPLNNSVCAPHSIVDAMGTAVMAGLMVVCDSNGHLLISPSRPAWGGQRARYRFDRSDQKGKMLWCQIRSGHEICSGQLTLYQADICI